MKRFSKIVSVIIEAPSATRHQRHELRLHVGGEAGIGLGHHIGAVHAPFSRRTRRPRRRLLDDLHAGLAQRRTAAPRWSSRPPTSSTSPAGDGGGHGVGAGLDPVGDDAWLAAVQRARRPRSSARRCRCPRSARPSRPGTRRGRRSPARARRWRAPSCPWPAPPPSAGSRWRRPRPWERRSSRRAGRRGARGVDVAAVQLDLGAHRSQALRCRSTGRAPMAQPPGSETRASPHARQQRPQHQDRGAHLAHDVVGRRGRGDLRRRAKSVPRRGRSRPARSTAMPCCASSCDHGVDVGEPRARCDSTSRSSVSRRRPSAAGRRSWRRRWDVARSGRPPRMRMRSMSGLRYIRGSATPRWPMYLPALSA